MKKINVYTLLYLDHLLLQIIVQSMKNNEKKLENEKFRFKTSKKN
jgi:hypothetical protein